MLDDSKNACSILVDAALGKLVTETVKLGINFRIFGECGFSILCWWCLVI
jgi:hypothetical protein